MQQVNSTGESLRWFSDGATMAYPKRLRLIFWFVNLALYVLLLSFDLRMRTGNWFPDGQAPAAPETLIQTFLSPLNIFQFPAHIFVIAAVTALLCAVPILTSLLYNVWHALPFLLTALFMGQHGSLVLCLLISCAAVSFRPLRFKSKFVALVLWLTPEVLYWVLYSGKNPEQDVLRWAVLYAPWAFALLDYLLICGVVILVGHFVRYRPGVLMPIFGLVLGLTVLLFHLQIGMNERDFQALAAQNAPERIAEFQSRSITPLIEQEAAERVKEHPGRDVRKTEGEIRILWRWAFSLGPDSSNPLVVAYQMRRYQAIWQIKQLLKSLPTADSRRADALYYIAVLYDLRVDLMSLRNDDMLRFYFDQPQYLSEIDASWQKLFHGFRWRQQGMSENAASGLIYQPPESSRPYWQRILERFEQTEVAIEARWRLAWFEATHLPTEPGQTYGFAQAAQLAAEGRRRCDEAIERRRKATEQIGWLETHLGRVFSEPRPTLSNAELAALQTRIGRLEMLLGDENRSGHLQHDRRLAEFIALDRRRLEYEDQLKRLQQEAVAPDPLLDNIELAQALLVSDSDELRIRLLGLVERYPQTDGGLEGMMILAQMFLEDRQRSDHLADRQELLAEAQRYLRHIISSRPDCYLAPRARDLLEQNPLE